MEAIVKPELSYNINQVCKEFLDGSMEVTYVITNEDNELIKKFSEEQSEQAYKTWWSWLNDEEKQQWEDYMIMVEAAEWVDNEQRWGW